MKLILPILIIILAKASFAQELEKQKAEIDAAVEQSSEQTSLKTVSFSIQAKKKVLHYISYEYIEDKNGYVKIQRQFSQRNDTIQQTFYFKNAGLIYATEMIISYFTGNGKTDSIIWKGDFYFAQNKLIDYITLGHGKSETEEWNPEKEMLTALNEAVRDIARHKKRKMAANNKQLKQP